MFLEISFDDSLSSRSEKGKYLCDFFEKYTVIDIETTGLEGRYDDIIEIAALNVSSGSIVDHFASLVHIGTDLPLYITELTGITDDMLATAPPAETVIPDFLNFIGDDVIVGHNINFDINFIYDGYSELRNNYADTMHLSRRLIPELPDHKLQTLAEYFNLSPSGYHRALADCETTFQIYEKLKDVAVTSYGSLDQFRNHIKSTKNHSRTDLRSLVPSDTEKNPSHPLYGKKCVFTGALQRYTREEAAQAVVNCGGECQNGLTKKTNYLILGNNEDCRTIQGGKSNKQKKAESYIAAGCDLKIITEDEFYEMLNGGSCYD